MRSKVLCRGCVSFVNKMEQFIQRAQSMENTPSDQSSEYAVKRCVQLSPSSLQPSKRLSTNMPSESSLQVDEPSKPITPTRKQLSFSNPQAATNLMPKSRGDSCTTSSVDQPKRNTSRSAEQLSFLTQQDATGPTAGQHKWLHDHFSRPAPKPGKRPWERGCGVLFDESLSIGPQVTAICKSAFCHLRRISLIRKYLNVDAAQLLAHALFTSKLDYCNSLLYGLPNYLIN